MSTVLPVATLAAVPRLLTTHPPMSIAEFEAFCRANDAVRIERTGEGIIRMNPPAGLLTSNGTSELNEQLRAWWKEHRQGRVFDSNGGFYLPDGSMLSPDAAYVSAEKLRSMSKAELKGFGRVCPAFVIELRSESDGLEEAKAKMEQWIANGVELAWLIDPAHQRVSIYRPGSVTEISKAASLQGDGPVAGFTLDLKQVWECYEV